MEKIGLIPAAGFAKRIAPLPCSKEIYPLGFRNSGKSGEIRPRVACDCLLESMAKAGADKAYVILRPEKWDIPLYLGSGKSLGLNLAYLITEETPGAPYTIDSAFPFAKDALIMFGFPDIVFSPRDAFLRLVDRQRASAADVVLGLYRAERPEKMDMVEMDDSGRLKEISIKPHFTDLQYTWILAVWTGAFTRFMHAFLAETPKIDHGGTRELYVGDVIQAGLQQGIRVETLVLDDGKYVDIGTPEDLMGAVKQNMDVMEEFSQ
jgi:glucose-1-phosphate thymidylyltransferase